MRALGVRLVIGAVLVGGLAGCTGASAGAGAPPDDAAGKTIFVEAGCGGCHVLRDARTTGRVGPNLDRIAPDEQHVALFVTNGGVGMPSFEGVLTHAEIRTVSRYVAGAAGY